MLTAPAIAHLDWYKHFLSKLNKHRLQNKKKPVWLDLQTLSSFQQQQCEQNTFTHSCSEQVTSNAHLLGDFTHLAVAMSQQNKNGNVVSRVMRLLPRMYPVAIDSVRMVNGKIEIGVVVLDPQYQLWGLKMYCSRSAEPILYPPNKLKKHRFNDYSVQIDRLGGGTEYIEIYMVKDQEEEISYGKTKYYHGIPQRCQKVYGFPVEFQIASVLDELASWSNKRRSGLVDIKFKTLEVDLLKSSRGLSLFKQMPKVPATVVNTNKIRPTKDENTLFAFNTPIGKTYYNTPKGENQQQQFQSIFDPKVNEFLSLKQNQQINSFSGQEATPISVGIISAKPTFSKMPGLLLPHPQPSQISCLHYIQNLTPLPPPPSPLIPPTIFSNKSQLISFLNSLSQKLPQPSIAPIPTKPTIVLVSSERRYEVSEPLISKSSGLIAEALRASSEPVRVIELEDFSREGFEGFLEILVDPTGSVIKRLPVETAMEIVSIIQYLRIQEGILQKLIISNLFSNMSARVFLSLLPILPTLSNPQTQPPLWQLFLIYWKQNSKQILQSLEQQLFTKIKQIDEGLMLEMVEKALGNVVDVNHMMDLLSLLVFCGYSENVIQVMEKRLGKYQRCLGFVRREFEIPKERNTGKAVLLEQYESKDIASFSIQKNQHNSHSEHLQLQNINEPAYQFKMKRSSSKSRKWIIICEEFSFANRRWRLIIQYSNSQICAFLQQRGSTFKPKVPLSYITLCITFHATIDCIQVCHTVFYSFAWNQDQTVGCVLLENYNYEDFALDLKVNMREELIHTYALQHMGLRWRELLKYTEAETDKKQYEVNRRMSIDMGRRRSCVVLENQLIMEVQELSFQSMFNIPQKSKAGCLYEISDLNLYYLFHSDNIEIGNQALLLLYLSKYYLLNPKITCHLPLTTLKFSCIRLKNLLSVSLYHPILKTEPVFLEMLEKELARRLSGSIVSPQKPRKNCQQVTNEQCSKQLIGWLSSDHFEVFKKKFRGMLHRNIQNPTPQPLQFSDPIQPLSFHPCPQSSNPFTQPPASPKPQTTIISSTSECSLF